MSGGGFFFKAFNLKFEKEIVDLVVLVKNRFINFGMKVFDYGKD